jgi:hypothetical protein
VQHFQLRRVGLADVDWPTLDAAPDRCVCQSRAWLEFVAATQAAEPVVAELRHAGRHAGWFTGLKARRLGVPLLGSPLVGWSTGYMGFNLAPDVAWLDALGALPAFAFGELGCLGLEVLDRRAELPPSGPRQWKHRFLGGFEIDLTQSEDALFGAMDSACRRAIRKAEKSGVVVQPAADSGFVDDYYPQLEDVFAKQQLVPTYSRARVAALLEHLLPSGQLLLLRALTPDGACIATGIFPGNARMFYFWGGASWRPHQHFRPNELVQWAAMQHWKTRGATVYDMGGGGEYKRKYGGTEIAVPWLRLQRYPWLDGIRETARKAVGLAQRLRGRRRK